MTVRDGKKSTKDRLSDFTRGDRIVMLGLMALVIGSLSALAAAVLVRGINLATNLSFYQTFSFADRAPGGSSLGLLVILVPAAGGLLIGLMARFGSEKIRGHGIPEALEAILIGRSRMDAKVAVLKPVSSVVSIGTGGPFGAEGPIIMTGGALGSLFAQLFHLSAAERKTLLVAGAAGGMAAVFAAPVAAVLLAVELLLFEWRPRSFIPVAVAASTAALIRVPLMGSGPVFPVVPHVFLGAEAVCLAFLVGGLGGLGSIFLTSLVYACEDFFHKLPLHWTWWPVLGGFAVGVCGWLDPRILGVGYDAIRGLLDGHELGGMLLLFLIMKAVAWAIALGSGTSGGVLAPLLMLGGAMGVLEAHWLPLHDPALWALVGMAAMMGGAMRAPLTAMVFALELTHDIVALPSLLAACLAAHAVTVLYMRRSILTEKLARRGRHLSQEYSVDVLQVTRVGEAMDREITTIPRDTKVADLARNIAAAVPSFTRHHAYPLGDDMGRLVGIVTRKDMHLALAGSAEEDVTVEEAGSSKNLVLAYEDETLDAALGRMLEHDVGRLLVVARGEPHRLVGYLGRSAILAARLQRYGEEKVREPGRLGGLRGARRSEARRSGA